MTEEPISLNKGYELPPRTLVLCHNHVAGRQEENFTNANQFYPGMYNVNFGLKVLPHPLFYFINYPYSYWRGRDYYPSQTQTVPY